MSERETTLEMIERFGPVAPLERLLAEVHALRRAVTLAGEGAPEKPGDGPDPAQLSLKLGEDSA